jgi:hypothetical protein
VEGDPVTDPPPVFAPTGPIPDLYTATPDLQRTFNFQVNAPTSTNPAATFMINGHTFTDTSSTAAEVHEGVSFFPFKQGLD